MEEDEIDDAKYMVREEMWISQLKRTAICERSTKNRCKTTIKQLNTTF